MSPFSALGLATMIFASSPVLLPPYTYTQVPMNMRRNLCQLYCKDKFSDHSDQFLISVSSTSRTFAASPRSQSYRWRRIPRYQLVQLLVRVKRNMEDFNRNLNRKDLHYRQDLFSNILPVYVNNHSDAVMRGLG